MTDDSIMKSDVREHGVAIEMQKNLSGREQEIYNTQE